MPVEPLNEILIYATDGGAVEVRLDSRRETLWLSLNQIAALFDRDKSVISRHLRNVFKDEELERSAVVAKNATTAEDGKTYQVEYFNLDAILSVGYRVNSVQGTRFRQWATRTLREHLTRGYTLNRQRFESNARELEAALQLVRKAAQSPELHADMGRGLVDIVSRYAQTFLWLQRYDEGLLAEALAQEGGTLPTMAQARASLAVLKADPHRTRRGHRPVRARAGRGVRSVDGQPRPERVRRARVSHRRGQSGAPTLLRDQEPPVQRRQQAQRGVPVRGFPAPQRPPARR